MSWAEKNNFFTLKSFRFFCCRKVFLLKNKILDYLIGFKRKFVDGKKEKNFSIVVVFLRVLFSMINRLCFIYYCSRPWYHDYQLKIWANNNIGDWVKLFSVAAGCFTLPDAEFLSENENEKTSPIVMTVDDCG